MATEERLIDIRDRQEAVQRIQRFLISVAYGRGENPLLTADGIYGEETREAVRIFQREEGLEVTGVVDFVTWELLAAAFEERERESGSDLLPALAFPMQLGDSGSYISLLQAILEELTGDRLSHDGFFGSNTEEAVRKLEKRYGHASTGKVDALLWRRLALEYKEKTAAGLS
ncbi:MAG: peptidoglycan-binding protein [Clostridia bacterium]|nr:peptidoglycan-binding protein [Clostridia bacterium]